MYKILGTKYISYRLTVSGYRLFLRPGSEFTAERLKYEIYFSQRSPPGSAI
jgi:hypothetical protein